MPKSVILDALLCLRIGCKNFRNTLYYELSNQNSLGIGYFIVSGIDVFDGADLDTNESSKQARAMGGGSDVGKRLQTGGY